MIESKNRVPSQERAHELCWPCRTRIARSGDEDDGDAVAAKLVCDGMAVDLDRAARLDDDGGRGVHSECVNGASNGFER
jgi:hypothetical protein